MKKTTRRILRTQHGMTLVEILIVLAILAAVAAMLLPRVTGGLDKANMRETKIQIGQIAQALSMYYTDCGKYPASLENLVQPDANCQNWGPEAYLKKLPKDPWNNDFIYELNEGEFSILSFGKDGKEGGDGANKDISMEDVEK